MDVDNQMAEMQQAYLNDAAEYFHTFSSDAGKEVLNKLETMTDISVLSPNTMLEAGVNINPAEFCFLREGQNSVVRHIKMMIKFHMENK